MQHSRGTVLIARGSLPLLLVWIGAHAPTAAGQAPTGNAFSYQGILELADGQLADGAYDLRFRLYDAAIGGSPVGTEVIVDDQDIALGLFNLEIDFGAVWDGTERYLEVHIRPGASTDAYEVLSPRQRISGTPHAAFADASRWTGLVDMPPDLADGVDNDTTYDAGTGLALVGTSFSLQGSYALPQSCLTDQVPSWNGTTWECGDAAGDITAVAAGEGLLGGAASGDAMLAVEFSGTGRASSAARGDHDHLAVHYTETELRTPGRAPLAWGNIVDAPFGLADGDDDTTYSAGTGLALNGGVFSAEGSAFSSHLVVAKTGGDFDTVQAAIDSITDASASNPYAVWIAPGRYAESVVGKAHVHLRGAARDAVTITSSVTSTTFPPDAATMLLPGDTSVGNLTVENTGTGARNVALLIGPSSAAVAIADVSIRTSGAGTIGYGVFAWGAATEASLDRLDITCDSHVDVYGIAVDDTASASLRDSRIHVSGSSDDAFGVYVIDTGSTVRLWESTVLAEGADDSYGLYLSSSMAEVHSSRLEARGVGTGATDSRGIYSFGELEAHRVTALGSGGRFYNYGLQSFGETELYGGRFEGVGGTGTSNVNAAVGVHARGPTYAEGITGIGRDHASRNQGLDNEGGVTTLVGGYFLGEGGTTAFGIENFGTGSELTATAVTAIGHMGTSGAYGLYNGGTATLNGGSFLGSQGGSTFGTFGIYNLFTLGQLAATGVSAAGEAGTEGTPATGEVWGLRNWLGTVTLTGGSITATGGTTAYGIDNDTSNARLEAHEVRVRSEADGDASIALYNHATADARLYGGSFIAEQGATSAQAIVNEGSGSTLFADNVTALAQASALNQGLVNRSSATAELTGSRLAAASDEALFMSSGTVRVGASQIDGSATRQGGTLTCVQTYSGSFTSFVCP